MHRLVSVSVSVSSQLCGCQRIIATPRYFKSMGILDELEAQWNSEGGSGSGFAVASSSRLPSASSLSLGRADQRRFITTATTKTKTSTTTTKTAKTKSPNHKSKEYVSILNSIKDEANDKGQSLDASCPDLSEYPLEALQEEVRFWGFRSSSSRQKLQERLAEVWTSLTRELTPSESASTAKSPSPSASSASSASSPTPTPEPSPMHDTFAETLQTTLTSDAQLYDRILLYEPIPFEEVWSVLKRKHPTVFSATSRGNAQVQVKAWLDLQGIVWYEGDFGGGGSRARW